jgi:hypothetical protein
MDDPKSEEVMVEEIKQQDSVPVPVTGGKRKSKRRVNPALGKWVAFVKKVQKEEKISYKEAMTRAKARKDKGEKWMGGAPTQNSPGTQVVRTTGSPAATSIQHRGGNALMLRGGEGDDEMEVDEMVMEMDDGEMDDGEMGGGRRRRRRHKRKTHKRRGSKKRRRTRRR